MSSEYAIKAITNLISTNNDDLINNIFFQNDQRIIETVTGSLSTPAKGFYHIALHDPNDVGFSMLGQEQLQSPPRSFRGSIQLWIFDAFYAGFEANAFEEAHYNFRRLRDRIRNLIASTNYIIEPETGKRFRLRRQVGDQDRLIRSASTIRPWHRAGQQVGDLQICTMSFEVESC